VRARGGDGGDSVGRASREPDSGSSPGPVRGRTKGLTGGARVSARGGEKEGRGARGWWAREKKSAGPAGGPRAGKKGEEGRERPRAGPCGERKVEERREKKGGRWAGPREKERERGKGKIADSNTFEL
jgi:hypothetical protein